MTEVKPSENVMQAVRSGRKIAAIKLLREETGLGLKEAKEVIDREIADYNRANPHAPIVQESSGCSGIVVVVILIALAVYWYVSNGP